MTLNAGRAPSRSAVNNRRGMMAVKLLIGLAAIFMFVSFAALNQKQVTLAYYGYEATAPIWLVSIVSFAAGAAVAGVLGALALIREKSRSFVLSRRLSRAEEDLKDLRQKNYADSGPRDQFSARPS